MKVENEKQNIVNWCCGVLQTARDAAQNLLSCLHKTLTSKKQALFGQNKTPAKRQGLPTKEHHSIYINQGFYRLEMC